MSVPEPAWVDALRAQGMSVEWAESGHCWTRSKRIAAFRYPGDDLGPLDPGERHELLWTRRAAVLQWCELPGAEEANAVLYVCRDQDYGIESLSSNNRSKVRRALKRMEVRQVTVDEVIATGYAPYTDTRDRQGGTGMTPDEFRANWDRQRDVPGREIWASVVDGEIAAFGAVQHCGRWATISATVSHRKFQKDYPNHALFFTILEQTLARPEIESVSYGLSSLRGETARDSLHHFKLSVGLEAMPVVRKVEVHPLLRPGVNTGTLAAARAVRKRAPDARLPMAVCGALEFLLDVTPASPDDEGEGDAPRAPAANGVAEPVVVRRMGADEVAEVADLHRRAFPAYVSTKLGAGYCRRMFEAFAQVPEAWVDVAVDGTGRIVGFLVAAPPSTQRDIEHELLPWAALNAYRSPGDLARNVRRAATRLTGRRVAPAPAPAEPAPPAGPTEPVEPVEPVEPATVRLVLVAVDAEARGQGVADSLLDVFARTAVERGHRIADLSVDTVNAAAHRAYARNGWEPDEAGAHFRLDLSGRAAP